MALFVDGPACTIDDLIDQDSGLLAVAQTTGINVSSKLRLAQEELKTDLQLWLLKPRPTLEMLWGPVLRVEQIVVTAPLKRWETMHALALVYRDAYFSQLVDRYQAKWQEFSTLARSASDSFVATGLGLVSECGGAGKRGVRCFIDKDRGWKPDDGRGGECAGKRNGILGVCRDSTQFHVPAIRCCPADWPDLYVHTRAGYSRAAAGRRSNSGFHKAPCADDLEGLTKWRDLAGL
jgi:hypothetical protein